ncbi:hypothetical protein [Comamonas testosteroni]|uniref:hypothetical protein n=1 Tax=Comamonas testosteroni TaxID=285 RepID=UPI0015F9E19C|nr:hypothetical protein [Comamonas testosteroni]
MDGVEGRDGTKNSYVLSGDYAISKRTSLNVGVFTNQFQKGCRLEPINIAAL